MAHLVGPDTTAGPTPAIHAGLNTKFATYTLAETASSSTTIAICALPGGAKVTDVTLQIGNDALDTTGGGSVAVRATIGGTAVATYVATGSGSLQVQRWNPAAGSVGVRLTSSANLIVQLTDFVGTGTASTVITAQVQYTASDDPD